MLYLLQNFNICVYDNRFKFIYILFKYASFILLSMSFIGSVSYKTLSLYIKNMNFHIL